MAPARDGPLLDQAMLERLYVKLEKPMYNVVYRWVWNADDAAEITQDAFLRVWNARDRVDVATVEALLYTTALNLAKNRRRSARVWRWLGLERVEDAPAGEPRSDEAIDRARSEKAVRDAIEALPDALRDVILLTEFAERGYAEVGAILGIPAGTVGSRRNTALAKLAERLGPIDRGDADEA